MGRGTKLVADSPDDPSYPLRIDPRLVFFAAITRETSRMLAGIMISTVGGVRYKIGGVVEQHHRHAGYGREALNAAVGIAHRHFGIPELHAGCETTNLASRCWLAGAGFQPDDGPATHTLPDGRIIHSLWWKHHNQHVTAHCPHLLPLRRPARARLSRWRRTSQLSGKAS